MQAKNSRKDPGYLSITPGEELNGKDYFEYLTAVTKYRDDPVRYAREMAGVSFEPNHKYQEVVLRQFYRALYDPNIPAYLKLVLLAGQRSGKTVLVSIMGQFELFRLATLPVPPWEYYKLLRGQAVMISILATGKEQASDSLWGNIQSGFEENAWFGSWTDLKSYAETIESKTKCIIARLLSSSSSTGAGRTNAFVGADEIDLFDDTAGKRGAWLIHDKMWNSCQTLRNPVTGASEGRMALISSSNDNPASIMNTLYDNAIQLDPVTKLCAEPWVLPLKVPTWVMNTEFKEDELREKYKNNLQAFYRDYACQPGLYTGMEWPEGGARLSPIHNVLEDFISEDPKIQRVISIDPSATNDTFGMGCGYLDATNRVVIDGVLGYTKPIEDPFIKSSDIEAILNKAYMRLGIEALVFDTWMYPNIVEDAVNRGITVEKHIVRKEDYDRWKGEENDGTVTVVSHPKLQTETRQLRVVNDVKVDHPLKGSKDMADSVANCIWWLRGREKPEPRKPRPLIMRLRG